MQAAQNSGLIPFKSHLVKQNDSTGARILSDFSTEAPSTPPTCQSCIGANYGGIELWAAWLHCPIVPKSNNDVLQLILTFNQLMQTCLDWSEIKSALLDSP